jgi:hypothetical protein
MEIVLAVTIIVFLEDIVANALIIQTIWITFTVIVIMDTQRVLSILVRNVLMLVNIAPMIKVYVERNALNVIVISELIP